jgi:uncharacterized membrane protein
MDNLLILHLTLGPLILVLALVFKRLPPRKINRWYGYRTPRSMRSQEAWNRANAYSANALLITAGLLCFFQLIFYTLIGGKESIFWSAGALVMGVLATIPLTEMHLKKSGY